MAQANQDEDEEGDDDRTDLDSSSADDGHTRAAVALTPVDRSAQTPDLKRSATEKSAGSAGTGKRRRVQSSLLAKFLNPDFPMFHNREQQWTRSEFGVLNDDLFFNDPFVADSATKNQ